MSFFLEAAFRHRGSAFQASSPKTSKARPATVGPFFSPIIAARGSMPAQNKNSDLEMPHLQPAPHRTTRWTGLREPKKGLSFYIIGLRPYQDFVGA